MYFTFGMGMIFDIFQIFGKSDFVSKVLKIWCTSKSRMTDRLDHLFLSIFRQSRVPQSVYTVVSHSLALLTLMYGLDVFLSRFWNFLLFCWEPLVYTLHWKRNIQCNITQILATNVQYRPRRVKNRLSQDGVEIAKFIQGLMEFFLEITRFSFKNVVE
jgi:hypothetical protein